MKKIGICGHFGFRHKCLDGQTIKTKIVTKELLKKYGKDNIALLDTHDSKKHIISILKKLIRLLKGCENVIIFPAHNGLRIFAPFLSLFNRIYKRKLHYIVIGGWLPEFIKNRKYLEKSLKSFDYIYVETNTMKRALIKRGFNNVIVMPNCKELKVLESDELIYYNDMPLRLCTFSRVNRLKGIEEACKTIKSVNKRMKKEVYSLDIYGAIDKGEEEWFSDLQSHFPSYIRYLGEAPFDKSVEIIKNYYALLFPTKSYTEGIPGTIIDAYASGVPVISSEWESFSDLIDKNRTGFGFEFENYKELEKLLIKISANPDIVNDMKTNCLNKYKEFSSDNVVNEIKIGGY